MALWAYKAYEDHYHGENGIYDVGIVEGDEMTVQQEAFNAACDVMESYAFIMEELEQDADYSNSSVEAEMEERALYECVLLDTTAIAGRSIEELDSCLDEWGYEEFSDRFKVT